MNFENPLGNGQPDGVLHAALQDGSVLRDVKIVYGQPLTLQLRLPPSATTRTLQLVAPRDYPLPAPDTRTRAIRVFSVRFAPAPTT
jgi:hypothetical protein